MGEEDGNGVTISTPSGPHQRCPAPGVEDIDLVNRYGKIGSKVDRRPAQDDEMNLSQIPMVKNVVLLEKGQERFHSLFARSNKVILVEGIERSSISLLVNELEYYCGLADSLFVAVLHIHIGSLVNQQGD